LRKRIERDVIVAGAARRTLEEAGNAYVDHLEHVMERKRSTNPGLPRTSPPSPRAVLR
jgi:hypothetical protein